MTKAENEEKTIHCPVCQFFSAFEKTAGKDTDFFKHLNRSRVEFLKAVRSLVDDRIDDLEKKAKKKKGKKATKIKVE